MLSGQSDLIINGWPEDDMRLQMISILSVGLVVGSTFAGPPSDVFKIQSIGLDPDTFVVTLVVSVGVRSGHEFGLQAHDGAPTTNAVAWTLIGTQTASGPTLTFVDDVSGSLSYSGKTYMGVISTNVYTVNQEYIGYPFLTNPVVTVRNQPLCNVIPLQYGEGIYSNTVSVALSNGGTAAFFRMWSPDNDPKNALIQVCTNSFGQGWTNCVTK
jgi:hypothetical protein